MMPHPTAARPARRALHPAPVALAVLLACTALAGQPRPAHAQATQTAQRYDIPAGPLDQALNRFAAEAGILLTIDGRLTAGKRSPGLRGEAGIAQALQRLLEGTGLEAYEGDSGYQLRRTPSVSGGETVLGTVQVKAASLGSATEGSGSYTTRATSTATRLPLSLRETPQSVSVVTRQQMDDQGLEHIADVLQQTPGITVNRDNTEGYSFYARGFQVENFQFDGVASLATAGGNVRDNYSIADSAIYDRVEVLKGATGLVNGAGLPSGVINMVRKRPTADFQGHASVGVGSWDHYRAEVDLSSPLAESGAIRGRVVGAAQHNRSFIEHLKNRQELFYGIVEADLAPATILSVGFDVQRNRNDASSNSHLPAFFSDGSPAKFSRSTNAADVWAERNHDTQRMFATLDHSFGSGWNLKATLNQRKYQSREIIAGMTMATIDPVTHSVAHGFYAGGAARFHTDTKEKGLDLQLSGSYSLFGREHQIVLGYANARTNAVSRRWDGDTDALIPDAFNWDNRATEPAFYDWWSTFDVKARQKIGYAATVFEATERLSLILGARNTDYSWSLDSVNANGVSSRTATKVSGEVTPYAGLTFDVDAWHTVYRHLQAPGLQLRRQRPAAGSADRRELRDRCQGQLLRRPAERQRSALPARTGQLRHQGPERRGAARRRRCLRGHTRGDDQGPGTGGERRAASRLAAERGLYLHPAARCGRPARQYHAAGAHLQAGHHVPPARRLEAHPPRRQPAVAEFDSFHPDHRRHAAALRTARLSAGRAGRQRRSGRQSQGHGKHQQPLRQEVLLRHRQLQRRVLGYAAQRHGQPALRVLRPALPPGRP
ncbi:TonB-dependent siderophore receptor [Pseudothauera nasutitermitis]|uniref:TonB-dependent siderophore receptor n=1 Tax=Pseudothauera nasutitermitis TaxID=2565930 RepID=A0A4S4B336_9RHOO|nr:TonB-dependent receptor [Pseudothauera nasutitermitis]THF66160.1 TonB-dependent siderophore receptor [Pseudothauera nasutitermitis]